MRRSCRLLPFLLAIPTSHILGIDDHTRGRGWRKSGRNGIDEPPVLAPAGERETGQDGVPFRGYCARVVVRVPPRICPTRLRGEPVSGGGWGGTRLPASLQ